MVTPLRSMLVTPDFEYRLSCLKDRTKDLLRFWQAHSPHYTDHGQSHCEAVETNLNELTPDEIKQEMSEYEIFLLLSGVELHDVGIMCAATSSESNNDIRKKHNERSRQFVVEKLKDLFDGPERYVVGEICFAHRDNVPIEHIERSKTIRHPTLGNKDIRVQFLAAMLRLADSCDLCHTRTSTEATSVSQPTTEASFYHALHERVSGIKFDSREHVIVVDLNVMSKDEEPICQRYIIEPLQNSLNSVRDCLTRNNVTYIDVVPKFSVTSTITTKLSVPKRAIAKVLKRQVSETRSIQHNVWSLYNKREYSKGLKLVEKGLKHHFNDILLWKQKLLLCDKLQDNAGYKEAVDNCLRLDPSDTSILTQAGHFYGETLLDIQKSFEFLEKAYKLAPDDVSSSLNYAEALVTVGRFKEAYNLATRYLRRGNNLMHIFNAQLIKAYAILFMGKKKLGLKELRKTLLFFKTSPVSLRKTNNWVYNKISKYINESSLDDDIKKRLSCMIDLTTSKISMKKCEKEILDRE